MPRDIRETNKRVDDSEVLLAKCAFPHPGDKHLALELWCIKKHNKGVLRGIEYVVWIVSYQNSDTSSRVNGDYFTVCPNPNDAGPFLIQNYQEMLKAYVRYNERLADIIQSSGGQVEKAHV